MIYKEKVLTPADCYSVKELKVDQIGCINKPNSVLFHGRFCPLSNFYPCNFTVSGNRFSCVEQYYQFQKTTFCGMWNLSHQILLASDPVDMKRLADSADKDIWPVGLQIAAMKTALSKKFSQNIELANFLKETGDKRIVECNKYDKFWGIGRSIYDKNAKSGPGENMLGRCLEEVRDNM